AFENRAKLYVYFVCCTAYAWGVTFAGSVSATGSVAASRSVTTGWRGGRETGGEDTSGPARRPGGAHRSLSRPTTGSGPGGIHVSSRDHAAPAMAGEEFQAEGQRTGRCCGQAALGSGCPGLGRSARRGKAPG